MTLIFSDKQQNSHDNCILTSVKDMGGNKYRVTEVGISQLGFWILEVSSMEIIIVHVAHA